MKTYQVVGIGNALVDVLTEVEDTFLADNDIQKGIMQLISMEQAVALYAKVGPSKEVSGGSAANTIAGIAQLGGKTAYIGKVKEDQLGGIFAHDLRAQGAVYETPMASKDVDAETGRCLVLITPDGERSMNTYLGVTEHLSPSDIDEDMVANAEWIYLEGYRFDGPESHEAFDKAIKACKNADGKVSITLSDPFCIERHRDAFRAMIRDHVDLLFCNRAEILSMYQTEDFDVALNQAAKEIQIVACTDSANGAHVLSGGEHYHIFATPTDVKDATGAGDLFAAGFLWGLTNGYDVETCGKMGCLSASEVISHVGARPEAKLLDLFGKYGLLKD